MKRSDSSLHSLVQQGDVAGVEERLRQGAEVDAPDGAGHTPLMLAARSDLAGVDMLRLLVRYGADVNAVEQPPPPPIPPMDWIEELPEELRKSLPDFSGGDNPLISPHQYPVLYFALEGSDQAKIEYLLDAGADLYYRRPAGYDVLIDAAYRLRPEKRLTIMEQLLERGAPVDGRSRYGESALSQASFMADFELVQLLLRAGADEEQLRWTPLMHAAVFGREEDFNHFLQKHGYEAQRDRCGRTAFLLAVQCGSLEKVHACLAAGADLEERDSRGKTALMYAAARNDARLTARLLERGASVDAVDKQGYTALMDACAHDARNTARLLLAAGADITLENNYGKAAVKLAVSPPTVFLLIEYGADWTDAGREQRRALTGLPVDYDPQVSTKEYTAGKHRRFGRRNPEIMDIPFWREMVKSGVSATKARMLYRDGAWGMPRSGKAVWCYERFGQSITLLPGGRIVEIGGEHEDAYDPEFCIYNDVVVFDSEGDFTIYGYPEAVFPPTDFHSATLVGAYIYLIGSLGYRGKRHYGETPVYRLDTNTFVMQRLHTTGDKPGWISRHRAKLGDDRSILITGGKVCRLEEDIEEYLENNERYVLDLEHMKWRRETGSY